MSFVISRPCRGGGGGGPGRKAGRHSWVSGGVEWLAESVGVLGFDRGTVKLPSGMILLALDREHANLCTDLQLEGGSFSRIMRTWVCRF